MASMHVDIDGVEWTSGVPFYGSDAMYERNDLVRLQILCDRRLEGGDTSWIAHLWISPRRLRRTPRRVRACGLGRLIRRWPNASGT